MIVDRATGIVLDGTHRQAVLENIGCDKAVCSLIDYNHPEIRLGLWYRRVHGSRESILEVARDFGPPVEESELTPETAAIMLSGGGHSIARDSRDLVEKYQSVHALEKRLHEIGCSVNQETEEEAWRLLHNDAADAIIVTPIITKEDVVDIVRTNRTLCPKSTRHVIPMRPLGVNIALQMLRPGISLEEARTRVVQQLKQRSAEILMPGNTLGSRTYAEEVYLFK